MEYLGQLLKHSIALCSFDFCGCGNAEGDYLTMGYYEQQDVREVVDHLISQFRVSSLALWGKSMGAVTALLYLGKTLDIKAVILDSPYRSLRGCIEH
jgi:alpha/beta superfamily hydrolase